MQSVGKPLQEDAISPIFKRNGSISMRELMRYLTGVLEQAGELIVCQVIETKGSTPQKAGAWMVIGGDGRQVGTLGGGCIEAEVKQNAARRLGREGAEIQSFVLDHDYAWADGLICGGKMVIATEAFRGAGALAYFLAYKTLLESGQGYTEAVVVDPDRVGVPIGARFLFGPDGGFVAGWPSREVSEQVHNRIVALDHRPKTRVSGGVAILPTLPRIRLVIVGAGHVGQGVASLAAQADFDVWIVDDRRQYANSERFPTAERLIIGPIDEVLSGLDVNRHTYALIVTRGHGHDQEALYHLSHTVAPYVGLIGSRRKIRLIFDSLREAGIAESDLARVSAPVGIEIGSQTVFEIAVSIVAELIGRRNLGPSANFARTNSGSSFRAEAELPTATVPE